MRLDGGEVDAIELPQAEEEFFLERLLGRDFFELLDREPALVDRGGVGSRIVSVGPAPAAVEGMRACAESEIGLAAPIFEVVARTEARQPPIGDLVVVSKRFC